MQYKKNEEKALVVLIYPKDPNNTKNSSSLVQASLDMPPLGLLYIGTTIQKTGTKVKIFDFNCAMNDSEANGMIKEIIHLKPQIIGFSVATTAYPYTCDLALRLRNELKKAVFIWGGHHVSFQPEEPLKQGVADIVIRGEGEEVIIKIISILKKHGRTYKQHLKEVDGISYFYQNQIQHNKPDFLSVKDLESIPIPDRTLIDLSKYKNASTILASRGCIGKCIFCASANMGLPRERDIESILREIDILVKNYGFQHIIVNALCKCVYYKSLCSFSCFA